MKSKEDKIEQWKKDFQVMYPDRGSFNNPFWEKTKEGKRKLAISFLKKTKQKETKSFQKYFDERFAEVSSQKRIINEENYYAVKKLLKPKVDTYYSFIASMSQVPCPSTIQFQYAKATINHMTDEAYVILLVKETQLKDFYRFMFLSEENAKKILRKKEKNTFDSYAKIAINEIEEYIAILTLADSLYGKTEERKNKLLEYQFLYELKDKIDFL